MENQSKHVIRKILRHMRNTLSTSFQIKAAQQINNKIQHISYYHKAKNIAFYSAFQGEVDLNTTWQHACSQQKQCYFPKLNTRGTLSFLQATAHTRWQKNQYGILEPEQEEDAFPISQLDIMFVPLLAFDSQGNRLGMGAGYYDKTLAHAKPSLLIGVAYEFQHIPCIKREPWDIPMDMVITEKNVYSVGKNQTSH